MPQSIFSLRFVSLASLALVAVIGAVFLRDYVSLANLAQLLTYWQALQADFPVLTLLAFIAVYAAVVAFSLPGALVMSLSGGILFGLVWGSLANFLGAWSGAALAFMMVRWGSHGFHSGVQKFGRVKAALNQHQITVLLLLRLIPVVPFFLANILPALWGVRLRPYAWTTAIGIIPGCIIYTAAGAAATDVLIQGGDIRAADLIQPGTLWPLFGLALLAVLPVLLAPLRRKVGI